MRIDFLLLNDEGHDILVYGNKRTGEINIQISSNIFVLTKQDIESDTVFLMQHSEMEKGYKKIDIKSMSRSAAYDRQIS